MNPIGTLGLVSKRYACTCLAPRLVILDGMRAPVGHPCLGTRYQVNPIRDGGQYSVRYVCDQCDVISDNITARSVSIELKLATGCWPSD